jgi:hypothetical protein
MLIEFTKLCMTIDVQPGDFVKGVRDLVEVTEIKPYIDSTSGVARGWTLAVKDERDSRRTIHPNNVTHFERRTNTKELI